MSGYYRSLLSVPPVTDNRFIMVVQSDNEGTSATNQFTIPTIGTGYLYDVSTDDGYSATGLTGSHTITFPSGAGTHEVYINGDFPKCYFNNSGDRLKLLEVANWGTYGLTQPNQSFAFSRCENLSQIADNGAWFDVVENGISMFRDNALTLLPTGMDLPLLQNGFFMFFVNSLSSLPEIMKLSQLTNGERMFQGNPLTLLPIGMELPLLNNGATMFEDCNLISLPSGMTLPLLNNGDFMFENNALNLLPSGMNLPLLSNGVSMFSNCNLTSLPIGMNLPLLNIASAMFRFNSLTSLPSGMNLPLLLNGASMFNNTPLATLPTGMTLPLLANGSNMFLVNTINTERYSQLLIDLESGNANNNVVFHGGFSKYNAAGEIARNILTSSPRNWTITDGGLEI